MHAIYKYPLLIAEDQTIALPAGARVLHVSEQFGTPCLWALVDANAQLAPRRFVMYATGGEVALPDAAEAYVGTAITGHGSLVWHFFEAPVGGVQ